MASCPRPIPDAPTSLAVAASDVVHRAIEVLGGNATIEFCSCLPRLCRDAEDAIVEVTQPAIDALQALPPTATIRRATARMIVFDHES